MISAAMFSVYSILLLAFLISCDGVPTIINSLSSRCDYEYEIHKKNKTIHKKFSVPNEVFHTVSRKYEVTFTLCGKLPANRNNCGGQDSNGQICLQDKNTKNSINVGSSFSVVRNEENDNFVLKSNGPSCVKIFFVCDNIIKDTPKLRSGEDDCDFEITMRHPTCQPPPCTALVNDRLIDLSKMRSSYLAKSNKTGNEYRFTICGSDQHCDDDMNACELTNQKPISLSTTSSQHLVYSADKHQLLVRGNFKVNSNMKRTFELHLKCNWDVEAANPVYSDVQIQGRKYKFEMESSFGCIKTPVNCNAIDRFYYYDLKNLNRGKWNVDNPDKRNILINICGNLKLPPNNRCSNSSSQVCEITANGEYINHGSTFTSYEIISNQVELFIINGQTCKENPSESYKTKINFECSNVEENPKLISDQNCVINLAWKTPKACPIQDKSLCTHFHSSINNNFNLTTDDASYNLNGLRNANQNFVVRYNKNNERIDYYINIGQPVLLEEAPCIKDAIILMKNYSAPHLKDRIVSLGRFYGFSFINKKLAIKTHSGYSCDVSDYEAIIYFECSQTENLSLLRKTKCLHEFNWKTAQACPTTVKTPKSPKQCNYYDANNNKFDFYNIGSTLLQIDFNTSLRIELDFCDDKNYKICNLKGNCDLLPLVSKTFSVKNTIPTMNFEFQHYCDSKLVYNRTIIEFVCDLDESNISTTQNNCTLNIVRRSNAFCSIFKNVEQFKSITESSRLNDSKTNRISNNDNEVQIKFEEQTKMPFHQQSCTIFNHNTGVQYSIPNFTPFNVPISDKCPEHIFNYTKKSILLKYDTDINCKSSNKNYSYDITLLCGSNMHHQKNKLETIKSDDCKEYLNYENDESCNLFHELVIDTLPEKVPSTLGRDIGLSFFGLVCLAAFTLGFIYRSRFLSFYRRSYRRMYPKDGSI